MGGLLDLILSVMGPLEGVKQGSDAICLALSRTLALA